MGLFGFVSTIRWAQNQGGLCQPLLPGKGFTIWQQTLPLFLPPTQAQFFPQAFLADPILYLGCPPLSHVLTSCCHKMPLSWLKAKLTTSCSHGASSHCWGPAPAVKCLMTLFMTASAGRIGPWDWILLSADIRKSTHTSLCNMFLLNQQLSWNCFETSEGTVNA